MQRILSMMLVITMLVSMLPLSAFATEEAVSSDGIPEEVVTSDGVSDEVVTSGEDSAELKEIPQNYGNEVSNGSDIYYIEDGNLLYSSNNGRPQTIDTEVTWVIEKNGIIYYSKLDGYNTYICNALEGVQIAKIFCPVECFDVDGEIVYYLYNGEVLSHNIQTNAENIVTIDKTMTGFYLDKNSVVAIDKINKNSEEAENDGDLEISLNAEILKIEGHSTTFYLNPQKTGTICLYHVGEGIQPYKYLKINKGAKICFLAARYKEVANTKNKYWNVNIPLYINANGISYNIFMKADDVKKYFTEDKPKNYKDYNYLSSIMSKDMEEDYKIEITDYLKLDTTCAGSHEPNNPEVAPKITKYSWASIKAKVLGFFEDIGKFINSIVGDLFTETNTVTVLGSTYNEGIYWYLLEDNTYVKKSEFDKYFRRISNSSVSSNIAFSSIVAPTGTIKQAGYPLSGTIRSNCNISTITGKVINSVTGVAELLKTVSVNSQTYSIAGSSLDYGLKFQYLTRGSSYYLQYEVTDITGNTKTWKSGVFSVEVPATQAPAISVSSIVGGQRVTATNGDGSLIHLRAMGKEQTGYGTVTVDFTNAGSFVVEAWATATGKQTSAVVTKTVSVSQVKKPTISKGKYLEDCVKVTIAGSGDIYYTINGKTPTKNSTKYTGPIYIDKTKTIKAFAVSHGCVNSEVSERKIEVAPPDAPVIKLLGKDKIAQGKSVKISWNKAERATSYTAYLLKDGEAVKKYTSNNTTATFVLDERNADENIEYDIKVIASNFKGDSGDSNIARVTAMHPVKITVKDRIVRENGVDDVVVAQIQERVYEHDGNSEENTIEGNVISVQLIDYDTKPSKPATPSKKGFDFAGYSEELYRVATQDTEVHALFEVKYYNVSFYDNENGKRLASPLSAETYMYTESATEPTNYSVPEGYVFSGWCVDNSVSEAFDFNYVDGDMVLDAVYSWKNEELPVYVNIDSVVRDDKSYSVNVSLKNAPCTGTDGVQGRIIAALYTGDDKPVYTQIHDLDSEFLNNTHDFDHSETIKLNYTDNISYASVYVVGVKGHKTGGALSEVATSSDITYAEGSQFWSKWSDWQTEEVTETDTMQVKTKTQYRYRDKSYTTKNDTKTLDGWTYYKTTIRKQDGPTTTTKEITPIDTDARTRTVTKEWVTSGKNQWNFYRYWGQSGGNYYVCAYKSGICVNYEETGWIDEALPLECVDYFGGKGYNAYAPEGTPYDTRNGRTYYYGGIRWVDTSHYEYTYTNTYYKHHFYKWSDYTAWDDEQPESKDNRKIKTRTMYSYRTVTDSANDDQEAPVYAYEKSGVLTGVTEDLNGELATVLIYKKTNTDPTEEQIEHVSQITIGEGNSYDIVAETREEPHYQKTGDFIVALALEGGEKLINIDYIKAPLPQYTINFYNNGELHTSVQVEEGSGIDVNTIDIPQAEGMRFVKWNASLVDITQNMDVDAVFEPEQISLVYIDYANESINIEEVNYGEYMHSISAPENVYGKTFKYWKEITDDMVVPSEIVSSEADIPNDDGIVVAPGISGGVTGIGPDIVKKYRVYEAVWEDVSYEVQFVDLDGNVIETQTVVHGEAASLPEFIEKDGVLYSWDLNGDEWWNVTNNMTIYPYVSQKAQVSAPVINVSTEDVGGTFYAELDAASDGGTIYYSYYNEITEELALEVVAEVMKETVVDAENGASISLMDAEISSDSSQDEPKFEEVVGESVTDYIYEYKEPIEINEGTVVYAFTVDSEGNISPISVFNFDYDSATDAGVVENTYSIDSNCPVITIADVSAKPGETVSVPVTIKNNPGIKGLSLIVGYDTDSIKLSDAQNGDVFADGEFSKDIRKDGSCKITWTSDEAVNSDGILVTLNFVATENGGEYDITLHVEEAVDEDEEEQPFATVDGVFKNEQCVFGDVNGDGEIDFADGILILKHDVGLSELDGDKLTVGDVNGDGEVDFSDAILVLKFDVGLISSFKK